jgi:hypothetical protein
MIVEAVGNIRVNLRDALARLAAAKAQEVNELGIITRVHVVKRNAEGVLLEEVTCGDDE